MAFCQTRKNKKQLINLRIAADALSSIADFAMQAATALFRAKQANVSNNQTRKLNRNVEKINENEGIDKTPANNNKPVKSNKTAKSDSRVISLRGKTIKIKPVAVVKKPKMKVVKEEERLSVEFVDTMYENMWKFINLDTIKFILKQAKCNTRVTHKDDVWNDDNWTKEFYNSICQKGPDNEGHYVYVNRNGYVLGTYEGQMIDSGDDGICHGAALAAALNDCGHYIGPLKMNPTPEEKAANYRTIMNLYKYIIKQGWWNEAIRTFLYDEDHWLDTDESKTKETNIALKTLKATRF